MNLPLILLKTYFIRNLLILSLLSVMFMNNLEYTYDKEETLNSLDKSIPNLKVILSRTYDDAEVESIILGMRSEFEALFPHILFIGKDDNPLLGEYFIAIQFLALYKELSKKGATARDVGKILYDYRDYLSSQSSRLSNFILYKMLFSSFVQKRNKKIVTKLNEANYPDNFKVEFVEGDGENFNWGWNFYDCPVAKFYQKHGGDELLPYVCAADFAIYDKIKNLEFKRTQTIAHGADFCDLRFKKGGVPAKGWPPEELIEWKNSKA